MHDFECAADGEFGPSMPRSPEIKELVTASQVEIMERNNTGDETASERAWENKC